MCVTGERVVWCESSTTVLTWSMSAELGQNGKYFLQAITSKGRLL